MVTPKKSGSVYVAVDQLGDGDVLARQRDLCRRDVDAGDTSHLRRRGRHRHAGAAPEIENPRVRRQPFDE